MRKLLNLVLAFITCGLCLFACAPSEYRGFAKEANEIFEEDFNSDEVTLKAKAKSEGIIVTFTYEEYKDLEAYIENNGKSSMCDNFKNELIVLNIRGVIYTDLGYRDKLIVNIEAENGDLLYQFEVDSYDSFIKELKIDNVH